MLINYLVKLSELTIEGRLILAAYAAVRYLCSLSPYGLDKCVVGYFDRFLRAGVRPAKKSQYPKT